MRCDLEQRMVCIIGLGYVGLPLAGISKVRQMNYNSAYSLEEELKETIGSCG